MKILLLGEYSGFFTNLKLGFEQLGCTVDFYHSGDGRKKIGGEHKTFFSLDKPTIIRYMETIKLAKSLKNYDLVLLINPNFVSIPINNIFFYILRKNNKKIFVSSCGDTTQLFDSIKRNEFDYQPYDKEDITLSLYPKVNTYYEKPLYREILSWTDKYIFSRCDKIVPVTYEYYIPFKDYKNIAPIIQMPINIDEKTNNQISFSLGEKIVIYFGKNKPFFKGASYIEPALKKLKEKYPSQVEIIVNDLIPYNEYLNIIDKSDIIIDQCKSYGWGMNAIIALSKGKVVLSGAEPQTLKYFNIENSPVINIRPNSEMIYNTLETLILNRKKIIELKNKSYNFAKLFHNSKSIAKKYLDLANTN